MDDQLVDGGQAAARVDSLRRTTLRGARLALAGFVLSRGILFVVYVVLARLLSPADFGRYAAASVIVSVGGLFAESGLLSALIQRDGQIEEAASTAFYSLLVSGILLTLAALALAPVLNVFFANEHIEGLAAVLSVGMLVRALTVVPDAMLQRNFSYARRVAVDPLAAVAFAVTSIIACARGAGAWGLVFGSYASLFVQVISAWGFAKFRPRRRLASIRMWRELASFARPVIGSEILSRVAGQLDTVLIGKFGGALSLGQYRNGFRLAQTPSDAFVSVVAYVLLPALARIAGDVDRLAFAVRRIFGLVIAAALPVSIALLALGRPAAVLLLGPKWSPAGEVIAALCGTVLGGTIISVASEVFKSVNKPRLILNMQFVFLCAFAVSGGAAASTIGFVGVAAALSAAQLITACYALTRLAPLIGLSWRDIRNFAAAPAICASVMLAGMLGFSAAVTPLAHPTVVSWALIVVELAGGALVYGATLIAVDGPRRRSVQRAVCSLRSGTRSALGAG